MTQYTAQYEVYKNAVEAELEQRIGSDDFSRVNAAMRYSLLGGGKRLRGVLALACCDLLRGDYKPALAAAAAVEMVHAYSLIHDDLPCMDDDAMRRGKPSCHIEFGEATALLAGDALLTFAFGVLGSIEDADVAKNSVFLLAAAGGHTGMILGQELDLFMEADRDLELINYNKTGKLIRAAAGLGAAAAGYVDCAESAALDSYATCLGAAFQIIDDILDVTATEKQLGKPIGSDAAQGKQTHVSIFGLEPSREKAAELTQAALAALDLVLFFDDKKRGFLGDLALGMLNRID